MDGYTKYAIIIDNFTVVFVDNDDDRKIVIKHGRSDYSVYYENDQDEYTDDDIKLICYSFVAEEADDE